MTRPGAGIAIIGAGPYGISLAAHLRARGVDFRIFGSPMRFWQDMPEGMALKSESYETNIAAPAKGYRFLDYCGERNLDASQPVAASLFTEYALWAQRELVPSIEDVHVTRLEKSGDGFALTLAGGERVEASSVVVATGLGGFERIPEVLKCLPAELAAHTSRATDIAALAHEDVTIVGGGQSALESAAFLHDRGVRVRIIVRGNGVVFTERHRRLSDRVRHPGFRDWAMRRAPLLPHYLPEEERIKLTRYRFPPGGTWWIKDALGNEVPILTRTQVVAASPQDGGVRLALRSEGEDRDLCTGYVIAGTGYEVDVDRIAFLDATITAAVARIQKAPKLSRAFESTVPGLHFVGPIAAYSFGPLLRFVSGAAFTAPTVAAHLARKHRR